VDAREWTRLGYLTDDDIGVLRSLVDRIAAKPPEGSVTVVVTAGGDDRFTSP
jgi:hypothetical protein